MNTPITFDNLEVGYDIPALPGMPESEIQTPCLVVDLDALERNIARMREFCSGAGVRHRAHAKMHKSVDVALYQIKLGKACGVCCQKVSEAEVFARSGVRDILVSNEVRDPLKIDRLVQLPRLGTRTAVCIDDSENVADLSGAAVRHGTEIEVLVEIDCGGNRCGVASGKPAVDLAKAVARAPNLVFAGLQAYQGAAQQVHDYAERKAMADKAISRVRETVDMLKAEGLACNTVSGGGTGTYHFDGNSGVYNELQCGSYAFMDAAYKRIKDKNGNPISEFANALFILCSVMSHAKADKAIVDAGLKVQSVDSGLPVVFGRDDVEYIKCSDEHGAVADPNGALKVGDKLRLVPGHCDPTCNLHDWYVGVRGGRVQTLWPVSARGKIY